MTWDEDERQKRIEGIFLAKDIEERQRLWEEGFRRLLHYVERHGDARVPRSYTDDRYPLGAWVGQQHVDHNSGTLEADRQRRLQDLPGWIWNASSST